ncbi:amidohydrolase family protein [Modestobacter italicus]|uniref:amidohydrolase family protein n=1 Tax=Modestobacter italicus (strain DSM 44449 / CECT 9708 / BC 501) TaxID=2732864 RepID=UPI001C9630F1|nr:amidohydrolase family protein [Modestobacter italicus]
MPAPVADLVLTGARVIDPETGLDGVRAVGLTGGTITSVGAVAPPAREVWDVTGQVLAPGFIDLHSHAQSTTGLRLQALDGVTTALELEAGVLPVAGAYARAEAEGRPVNFGFSASWTDARMHVLDGVPLDADGSLDLFATHQSLPNWRGPAGDRDVARVLDLLEGAVADGALGIGVLVGYAPDSGRAEYFRLAGLAARLGVPTFTHTRYISTAEPGTSLEGALEVIAAAAGTGAHMHMCHVNSTSTRMIDEVAGAIDTARRRGVRVSTEAYPYGAGATVIGAAFLAPEVLSRLGIGPQQLTYLPTGERVADAARLAELRAADPGGDVVVHFLDEDDPADLAVLERSFTLPDTAIATDAMPLVASGGMPLVASGGMPLVASGGMPLVASGGMPLVASGGEPGPGDAAGPDEWPPAPGLLTHPRSAGSYARTLRWLVRERGLLTLTEALRRSSLLPAQLLEDAVPAMRRKGRVQVGADADLVVLDPDTVTDHATYTRVVPSTGFRHVLVGGTPVVRDGELQLSALPGRPVRSGDR